MSKEMTEQEKAEARGDFLEESLEEVEEEAFEEDVEAEEEDAEAEEAPEEEGEDQEEQEDYEEDGEDEYEEEPSESTKQPRIPKSRLDKEIAKRRKAEERQAELENRILDLLEKNLEKNAPVKEPEPEPFDFKAAEKKFSELFLNGDLEEANKIRDEIRVAEREEILKSIQSQLPDVEGKANEILEERDFNKVVNKYIQENPVLNEDSPEYDEELVDDINIYMRGRVARGDSRTEALDKAIKRFIKPVEKGSKPKLGKDVNREKKALKKAVKASREQPKKLRNTRSTTPQEDIDIAKMTDEEYRSLRKNPKLYKDLRGDNG